MSLKDFIDEMNNSRNVFIILVLSFLFTIPQVLSFFGIKEASDLILTIYNITSAYKNFNVDLKILIWSTIDIGFTFYVYKLIKNPTEDPKRIDDLTAKIETLKNQVKKLSDIQSDINVEGKYETKMGRVAEGAAIYFKRYGISSDLYKVGWNRKRDNTVWILYLGVKGIKDIPEELIKNLQYLESKYAVNIKITDDTKQFLGTYMVT